MRNRTIIWVLLLTSISFAEYTYVIDGGFYGGFVLHNGDTLLMTDGTINANSLSLHDASYANIHGTTPLTQDTIPKGGISFITLFDHSHLDISGGEIWKLHLGYYAGLRSDATVTLSGGRIDYIYSHQYSNETKHITMICDVSTVNYSDGLLTGKWSNGDHFSIRLVDIDGYDPAYSNIQFIPEPATMLLFAVGGICFVRKRRTRCR